MTETSREHLLDQAISEHIVAIADLRMRCKGDLDDRASLATVTETMHRLIEVAKADGARAELARALELANFAAGVDGAPDPVTADGLGGWIR